MRRQTSVFLIRMLLIVFAVYAVYNLVSIRVQIGRKQEEAAQLKASIYGRELANQQIEESIGETLTDDEIADIARDKLGYSLPGERIFVDITGK